MYTSVLSVPLRTPQLTHDRQLHRCPTPVSSAQRQDEAEALGELEQAALLDFRQSRATWCADLGALAADADAAPPSMRSAKEVAATARMLGGDDRAISEAADGWHGKLIAKLLYQKPSTLRWQLRDVLDECLPASERASLDHVGSALVAILCDDPYAMLRSVRACYGDCWFPAHLWDLLWRAGVVGVDLMDGQLYGLDHRRYLMLQHARGLGSCDSLWQLSAQYAADLLEASLPSHLPAAGAGAPVLDAESMATADAAAADAARVCLRELVSKQATPMHAVKLRKLLALCEMHELHEEAQGLVSRAAAAKRAARGGDAMDAVDDGPPASAGSAHKPPVALTDRLIEQQVHAEAVEGRRRLNALASRALDEAVDVASGGVSAQEGPATSQLRAMLRCEGVGGASYYVGPGWLPPYFALLGVLATPHAAVAADGDAPHAAQQAKTLLVKLAVGRGDLVGDGLPDALMFRLLRFFAGLERQAPSHAPMLFGHMTPATKQLGREAPTYSKADTHTLMHTLEGLKYTLLNDAPLEAANNRAQELTDDQRALSRALSESLATAMLDEAAKPSRGTCWAAGI